MPSDKNPSLAPFLKILSEGLQLNESSAFEALNVIMDGHAASEEIAAFLMGLRSRGESLEELTGFTRSMRKHATKVENFSTDAVDIVGTGGDGLHTFNISTTSAFVCAGAGAVVAKHGNRAISSKAGSADVLKALGVETELKKDGVEFCIKNAGIAFLFAPFFHPSMKHVMPVRRALGVRTFFNILGPLCNPSGVSRLAVGAFDLEVAKSMAGILDRLGAERFVSLHAHNGMDEMSISGPTHAIIKHSLSSELEVRQLTPEEFGIEASSLQDLIGGSAEENAAHTRAVLNGEKGAKTNVVILNAGLGIYAAGLKDSIEESVVLARESIESGKAMSKLESLVEHSNKAPKN